MILCQHAVSSASVGWENNANEVAVKNANGHNTRPITMCFYLYWSNSRLQFHELRCALKCLNKIQKCTKSTMRQCRLWSTETKSNFTGIRLMARPPTAWDYRFHHVTKNSIHWPCPCHCGAVNFFNPFSCSPESDELVSRTQTRLPAWSQICPMSPVSSNELQSRNSPPRLVTLTTLQYFHEFVLSLCTVINLSFSSTVFAKSSASMTGWLDKLLWPIFCPTWVIRTSSEFVSWIPNGGRHAGTTSGMSLWNSGSTAWMTAILWLVMEDFCSHDDRSGCRIIFLTAMMTSWQNLISSA